MALGEGHHLSDRIPFHVPMLALLLGLLGCARHTPQLAVGPLAGGLEPFLADHVRPAEQPVRVDEVARTPSASYHLVQVHGSEKPHRHLQHDLTVLVLRGEGTLVLSGTKLQLAAGDVAVIARGTVHWFASAPGRDAVALVTFAPALDAPDTVPAEVIDSPAADR